MRSALHAELLKLATMPAIRWTAALTAVATVLLLAVDDVNPVTYAQVGFLLLGALATTSDTGATSLLCVPRRLRLSAAKALALTVAAAPLAAVLPAGRAGAWAAAYLLLTALQAAAVGTLLRAAIPTVAVLLGHYVVAAPLLGVDWLPGPRAAAVTVMLWTGGAVLAAGGTIMRRDA